MLEPVKNNCETEIVAFVFWLFDKKETNQKALEKRSAPQFCFVPKVLLLLFLCLSHSTAPNLALIVLLASIRTTGFSQCQRDADKQMVTKKITKKLDYISVSSGLSLLSREAAKLP